MKFPKMKISRVTLTFLKIWAQKKGGGQQVEYKKG